MAEGTSNKVPVSPINAPIAPSIRGLRAPHTQGGTHTQTRHPTQREAPQNTGWYPTYREAPHTQGGTPHTGRHPTHRVVPHTKAKTELNRRINCGSI